MVFGENAKDTLEVWYAVETDEDDENDNREDPGDRSVRWLEKDKVDCIWRTQPATMVVGKEHVCATKRVIMRRSKEELVYELNAADVPTEMEKE